MAFIDYFDDVLGFLSQVSGNQGRLNSSSRNSSRSYYVSRDNSEAYSLIWADASSEAGDFIAYWKNDSGVEKHLVFEAVGLNSSLAATFSIHQVTGTAAGGAVATPFCLNRVAPKVAQATCRTAVTTPITGLTSVGEFDHANVVATGHEELRLLDRVRIPPGGAVAVSHEVGSVAVTKGVLFAYYENAPK